MTNLNNVDELKHRVHVLEDQVEELSTILIEDGELGSDSIAISPEQGEIMKELERFKKELSDERVVRLNLELELARERTRFSDLYDEMKDVRGKQRDVEFQKQSQETMLLQRIDKLIQTVSIGHILKGAEAYKAETVNMAIATCNLEALKFMFRIGALDDLEDYNRALLHAVTLDYVGVIEYLLRVGERMNLAVDLGKCLIMAATKGLLEVTRILIEAGADVNHCEDEDKERPLHVAARKGQCLVVVLLKQRNADVSLKNKDGKTPYDLAKEGGHVDTAHYLKPPPENEAKIWL